MRFLMQLDSSEFPDGLDLGEDFGILQLFYCSTDDGNCETWRPFSGAHSFRFAAHESGFEQPPQDVRPLPRKVVTAWIETIDTPDSGDHESLGITYGYDFHKGVANVYCEEPKITLKDVDLSIEVAETVSTAYRGDKLSGWPHWVQGPEYPNCPKCGASMDLLFQLDSEDNLQYMFGDVGCGHITQCRIHPDVFAFGWACG